MTHDLLGFLVSLDDQGSDDTMEEHLVLCEEMIRRSYFKGRPSHHVAFADERMFMEIEYVGSRSLH